MSILICVARMCSNGNYILDTLVALSLSLRWVESLLMGNGIARIVPLLLVLLSGCTRAKEAQRSALTSWIEKNLETSAGKIPGASVAVIGNYRI